MIKTIRRIGPRRSHMIPAFFEPHLTCPIPLEQIASYRCLARRATHPLSSVFCLPQGRTRPLLIGFVGKSGTGKSTVAREWAEALGNATIVDQDSTLREHAMRPGPGLIQKYDLELANKIILALLQFQPFIYRPYSPITHSRLEDQVMLSPTQVFIVEGVLALKIPAVQFLADIKIYVDCHPYIAFERQWTRAKADGRYHELSDDQLRERILSKRIDEDPVIEPQLSFCDFIINTDSTPMTIRPLTSFPNPHLMVRSIAGPTDLRALPVGSPN